MQTIPLRTALLELAQEHEERARRLEEKPQPTTLHLAQAERRTAEEARSFAESLRF